MLVNEYGKEVFFSYTLFINRGASKSLLKVLVDEYHKELFYLLQFNLFLTKVDEYAY